MPPDHDEMGLKSENIGRLMLRQSLLTTPQLITAILMALELLQNLAHGQAGQISAISAQEERCIVAAAQFQSVNHGVLRTILNLETHLKPGAVTRNANG